MISHHAFAWVENIILIKVVHDLLNLLFGIVEVSFCSESVSDDGILVVYLGSQLLTTYRANVSLSHITKKLYLPLLSVARHSSEHGASFALCILNFVLAPKDDSLSVGNRSKLSSQLSLLCLEHLFNHLQVIV